MAPAAAPPGGRKSYPFDVEALRGVNFQYGYASSSTFKPGGPNDNLTAPIGCVNVCQDSQSSMAQGRALQQQELQRVRQRQRECVVGSLLGGGSRPPAADAFQSEAASRYQHMQNAGSQVVNTSAACQRRSLEMNASRPNRYHQLRRSCEGLEWQTEQSAELGKVASAAAAAADAHRLPQDSNWPFQQEEKTAVCPGTQIKSNINFGPQPACIPGASPGSSSDALSNISPDRPVIQKAASEPSLAQNVAINRIERERISHSGRAHIDFSYGALRESRSRWQSSQAAVMEQNLSEKFECERQVGAQAMQGANRQGKLSNINFGMGGSAEYSDRNRESCSYGQPRSTARSSDAALPTFGARTPASHKWSPPPPRR